MNLGRLNVQGVMDAIGRRLGRLGIFLEDHAARIVKLSRGGAGQWRVEKFGELGTSLLHVNEVDRQRVRQLLRQVGGRGARAAANVEHPSLRIRRMNIARMPERDLLEAIRWNLREFIEGPVEGYTVGFVPLEEQTEEGRVSLIAYGLATAVANDYVASLKELGLRPVSLEPTTSALLAAFDANGVLADGKRHVCIFLNDRTTTFSVMRGRALLFSRPLQGICEEALQKLLMRNLDLDAEGGRRALLSWVEAGGVPASLDEGTARRLEVTVGHFMSQLAIEVQRSIDAFCVMYDQDRVDALHLCGRGALYPGICEHAQKALGVPASVFNPFERLIEPARQTDDVRRTAPLYAAAVGLAIP
jgi:type IV pilus assembly protein PilM